MAGPERELFAMLVERNDMEKIQPTPAEVEEFWERCDLYAEERGAWSGKKFYSWFAPNKLFICDDAPPIDLNNLFRYAVPKLFKDGQGGIEFRYYPGGLQCVLTTEYETGFDITEAYSDEFDPAFALFWTIWSVFHA
jgi:hypothetical protein